MTWRVLRFAFLHAARDAGASAISQANTWSTTQPKDYLIDDRAGSLATFTAAATDHHIQIDRGAGTLEEIDRLIIPAGHNYNGENVRVRTATDSGFTTGVVEILAKTAISAATMIDLDMTGGTEAQRKQRYVRLDDDDASSWNPETPELIFTRTRTPSDSCEPEWTDQHISNTIRDQKLSGVVATFETGVQQREFEFSFRALSGTDLTLLEALIAAVGIVKPFYIDPPFDDEAAMWVKLQEDPSVRFDVPPPAAGTKYKRFVLSLLEHLA